MYTQLRERQRRKEGRVISEKNERRDREKKELLLIDHNNEKHQAQHRKSRCWFRAATSPSFSKCVLFAAASIIITTLSLITVITTINIFDDNDADRTSPLALTPSDLMYLQQPPLGHPWYKWGNNNNVSNKSDNNNSSEVMHFKPLMDALVTMDQKPTVAKSTTLFPLLLVNNTLFHSDIITQSIIGSKKNWRGRYPGRILQAEDMIHEAMRIAKSSAHYSDVHNNQSSRFKVLLDSKNNKIPILLRYGDYAGCGKIKSDDTINDDNNGQQQKLMPPPVPFLSWCRPINCYYSWPIPSYNLWEMFAFPMKYGKIMNNDNDWIQQQTKWNNNYPWATKIRRAIWRGSPTGKGNNATAIYRRNHHGDYNALPRVNIVRQSHKNKRDSTTDDEYILDAAFTSFHQIHPSQKASFQKEFFSDTGGNNRIRMIQQQKYLAIIDVDGNTWSSRFGMQLCLNSVTIKITPEFVDYFLVDDKQELQPWIHYVPANLTNLMDTIKYVLSDDNQDEMKHIVKNANEWCRRKMTRFRLATDMLWQLVSYVELLDQTDPHWQSVWKKNNTAYQLQNLQMTNVKKNTQGVEGCR